MDGLWIQNQQKMRYHGDTIGYTPVMHILYTYVYMGGNTFFFFSQVFVLPEG